MKQQQIFTIVSLLFLIPYILGLLFSTTFWATHHLAFLPKPIGIILVGIAVALIILVNINKPISFQLNISIIVLITLVFGLLFYLFPIVYDLYGDAYKYWDLRNQISNWTPTLHDELFSMSWSPASGRKRILLIINWLSATFNTSVYTVFRWFNTVLGMLFVFSWLYFIRHYIKNRTIQLFLVIAVLFAPLTQFFYNHLETYAVVYLGLSWWIMCLLMYLKTRHKKELRLLIFLFIVNLIIHPTTLLLLPTLLLLIILRQCKKEQNISWKLVLKYMLLPKLLIGLIAYFFIFKDYNDLRFLDDGIKDIDRLFLPIINPPAPLDRYSMFGLNHIFDFILVVFQWSSIIWLIIFSVMIRKTKALKWNSGALVVLGELLVTYCIFFFALNPLLSLPMEVDLFSIPSIILIAFALVLLKDNVEGLTDLRKLTLPVILLALLSFSIIIVNGNKRMLSYRLEQTNIHVFKTYYLHSNHRILLALSMLKDEEQYIKRSNNVIETLEPFANKGNDIAYANLLMDNAIYYLDQKAYNKANTIAYKAFSYDETLKENIKTLLLTSHYLKDRQAAYDFALKLKGYNYPNAQLSGKVVIQMALENNDGYSALMHAKAYLKEFPNDMFIMEILKELQNGIPLEVIKRKFQ